MPTPEIVEAHVHRHTPFEVEVSSGVGVQGLTTVGQDVEASAVYIIPRGVRVTGPDPYEGGEGLTPFIDPSREWPGGDAR